MGKRIEALLKAKNNKRKLKESIPAGDHAEQTWLAEGKDVYVLVYEFDSPQEASRTLDLSLKGEVYAEIKERLHAFQTLSWSRIREVITRGSVIDDVRGTSP